jgi:hypothetical protein
VSGSGPLEGLLQLNQEWLEKTRSTCSLSRSRLLFRAIGFNIKSSGETSMSTSLFDGARLEIEYDEKFAVRKLTDDQEAVTPYGDTPAERLKTFNFAQWCDQAAICTRFCRLCGFPMGPIEDTHPDDRCPICAAMETTLFDRSYWENLKVGYSRDDRSRMGLELE